MKNWRTTLAGAVGGLTQIVNGIAHKDWASVGSGVAIVIVGICAKDSAVSGTGL